LNGFSEAYTYDLEDIDFCLRLERDIKKKCFCMNDMGLQHVDGAMRKEMYKDKSEVIENNHKVFKEKWNTYIQNNLIQTKQPSTPASPTTYNLQPTTKILFVLPQTINGNSGLHVQLHSARLKTQGVSCAFVVPDDTLSQKEPPPDTSVFSYTSALSPEFAFPYDIIHAWTPREKVRKVCEALLARRNCPLIIHLEDNEEYLTEVTTGKSFSELNRLPDAELDKLIPEHRYHPRKGRTFLDKADGLTLIIDTLDRFNTRNVPSMVLPPPVDERLFYPRPLNLKLRQEQGISDETLVLAYTGNVHDGNKGEVHELYKATTLLNKQGCPTVLFRTGLDKKGLGAETWDRQYEKHLGWVERNQLPDVLAAADVLVQPGAPGPFNDERIPSKLPEFFAIGRPVVLPKTNLGLKVEHEIEGYVLDQANAQNIAAAVKTIFQNKDLIHLLSERSVDFYLDQCRWIDKEHLMTLYTEIMRKS
jgi:glycosyltransferase involved in cell wall biosynthesis